MNYEKIEINNGSTLNIIKTDKFKNIAVMLTFKELVNKNEASNLMLLSRMIAKATAKYPSMIKFSSALESLYGATLNCMIDYYGNIALFNVNSLFIDDKFLPKSENLLEEQFKMLSEVVYHPFASNDQFDEKFFIERKANYVQSLMSLQNDKDYQASKGIKEMFDKEHPIHVSKYGTIVDAKKIENKELYQKYLKLIEQPCDVFVLGDVNTDEIKALVEKYFKFKNAEISDKFDGRYKYHDEEFEEKVVPMSFSQSQLLQAYYIDIDNKIEKNKYVSLVFNCIFGGGMGSSKLFNSVREEHGLCYSIYSQFYLTYNVLFVSVGLSAVNYEKCTDLIKVELENIKEGKISDEELNMAKNIYLGIAKTQFDSMYSAISFYQKDILLNQVSTIEAYEKGISSVTKEDIMEFAKKTKLIKQFFVKESKGENNHEKDVL
jgi:predicted Zn-dependent peptidase